MEPRVVVFDIDGMLNHGKRFSDRLSEQYGIPMERIDPFFTGPFNGCLVGSTDLKAALAPYLPRWAWDGDVDDLVDFWFTGDEPDARMLALAERLGERVPCVVATNQERYRTNYLREELNLEACFERVYSSGFLGSKKPQRAFFDIICEDYGCGPRDVVFWDDDLKNVAGAQAYGFRAFRFTSPKCFVHTMRTECGIDLDKE